jgi:hypothetical protein
MRYMNARYSGQTRISFMKFIFFHELFLHA